MSTLAGKRSVPCSLRFARFVPCRPSAGQPGLSSDAGEGRASPDRLECSAQWQGGRFRNRQPLWMNTWGAVRSLFSRSPHNAPSQAVPVVADTLRRLAEPPRSGLRATWFGHSSVFLEIEGYRILIDPVWSERASPVSFAGPKRWYPAPVALEDLPRPDLVAISHDHYDHLDRSSIQRLDALGLRFLVPLGVGRRLHAWGVAPGRVRELDWWETHELGGLRIHATPARHAGGRGFLDRDRSLWCGYAFEGDMQRAYYSGDTGMMDAFAEIGRRFGPFDLTMLEIGEYSQDWPDWHMGPEQAVAAHRLVGGRLLLPVHWGLFSLSTHAWTEPIERVVAEAADREVTVATPRPGGSVEPDGSTPEAFSVWWPSLPWRRAEMYPVHSTADGRREPGTVATPPEHLVRWLYDLAFDLEQRGDQRGALNAVQLATTLTRKGP